MADPVLLVETGQSYDRASICSWLQKGNRTCPKTNRTLKSLLIATNWTLRSIIHAWAAEHGVQLPEVPAAAHPPVSSHPISVQVDGDEGADGSRVPSHWTFFQGYDSPGGDLFRLHIHEAGSPALMQLLEAADKVPNCIAVNSSGFLKSALKPRAGWVMCEDPGASSSVPAAAASAVPRLPAPPASTSVATTPAAASTSGGQQAPPEQSGLYVRTQVLPFLEAGCSSWAADSAVAPPVPENANGWTFFPGMDSPGGDICQAVADATSSDLPPPALTSTSGSIASAGALALLAMARPLVVAFNSNGWLKALLQPMHGWVKWTTEAGKGLFVRNDVLMALLSGVLAHVQGNQLAPVQLAGWTFFQGLDSLGGDVHWSWGSANDPHAIADEACAIDGVIAFNTNGYIKTALRPRSQWLKVDVWTDKPSSGMYVHNSVLWKLVLA
ncbi:hypothetical protein FOA52_008322 [Chlamydomonas sp. UWO 241]|nr:hypothetical protein FOA52_008322 [Chlamydomonas sp. UWO 241]